MNHPMTRIVNIMNHKICQIFWLQSRIIQFKLTLKMDSCSLDGKFWGKCLKFFCYYFFTAMRSTHAVSQHKPWASFVFAESLAMQYFVKMLRIVWALSGSFFATHHRDVHLQIEINFFFEMKFILKNSVFRDIFLSTYFFSIYA